MVFCEDLLNFFNTFSVTLFFSFRKPNQTLDYKELYDIILCYDVSKEIDFMIFISEIYGLEAVIHNINIERLIYCCTPTCIY